MTFPSVASAPLYRPAFYCRPRLLVQSWSVSPRPALPSSICCYTPRIEMNRNEEEKSRNNRTIKMYFTQFSSPNANRFSLGRLTLAVSSASQQTPANEKEGQKRSQRKHSKNTIINQILPFIIQNLSPVARSGDGAETANDR